MFPKHCSVVGLREVSFPLTEKDIRDNLLDKSIYKKTGFIILNNGDAWAVVAVVKAPPQDLFSAIEDVKIISLPKDTKFIEDPAINVLSSTMMAERAEELGAATLVVKGRYEHVSFIHKEVFFLVHAFEVFPPEPPKLMGIVKEVLHSESLPKPVRIVPHILDLRQIEQKCSKKIVMFPCHASGLTSEKETCHLDSGPEISEEESKEIILFGCDLSLRIFKNLYGHEPEFFNFCPKKLALDSEATSPSIARCCTVKEGFERIGNIALVPWGATRREVEDALDDLLKDI